MEARKVSAGNGPLWIKQGYRMFKKNPILWIVLSMIGTIGLFVIASLPVIGDPLATLLFPVLLAGFMVGCRAQEQGEELELAHLFAGLQHNAPQLITLGGINLVSQYLILGVMKMTGGAALVDIMLSGKPPEDPAVLMQAASGAGLSVALGLMLFTVLLMAMQLAPMLVVFDKLAPVMALKTSLQAFLRNMGPLTVYSLMMMVLALLASMPMMLGWVVLLPVALTSMYAIYRDLFPPPVQAEPPIWIDVNTFNE